MKKGRSVSEGGGIPLVQQWVYGWSSAKPSIPYSATLGNINITVDTETAPLPSSSPLCPSSLFLISLQLFSFPSNFFLISLQLFSHLPPNSFSFSNTFLISPFLFSFPLTLFAFPLTLFAFPKLSGHIYHPLFFMSLPPSSHLPPTLVSSPSLSLLTSSLQIYIM